MSNATFFRPVERERERERERALLNDNASQNSKFFQFLTSNTSFKLFLALFLFALIFLPDATYAAGGMEKAKTLLDKVAEWLRYISIATVTIAILVVGYKVIFGGQTIRECTPIIIGALLIASASEIAQLLMS